MDLHAKTAVPTNAKPDAEKLDALGARAASRGTVDDDLPPGPVGRLRRHPQPARSPWRRST